MENKCNKMSAIAEGNIKLKNTIENQATGVKALEKEQLIN